MDEMLEEQAPAAAVPEPEDSGLIFVLDIGTRSVTGIVGAPKGDLFQVLAVETEEHTRRAVVDGQIEDITQTALVAENVKNRLEKKVGIPLQEVCIAAAGRALETCKADYEIELDEKEPIQDRQVLELETGAIQRAYEQLHAELSDAGKMNFLCVGHSVVKYWLDGYEISTLLDHKGRHARCEIIATFLPGEVVESLYAVMRKVGLRVASVTLEPIAAMNAVIPRELRMLNLALVDIGGGTSDIAISNNGSVTAYTMATIAGDEITEAIMKECLVDFETAEKMKMEHGQKNGLIGYRDILGFSYEISASELAEKIRPAVEELASEISGRILECNGKPPAAVFLVGGGCQLAPLCGMIAGKLSIDEKKVAVGGNNYLKRMVETDLDISGPEFATPVGIAVTAMTNRLEKAFSVTVNGKKVTLLKKGVTTLLEILLLSGCQYSQIMGRSGASVIYECNGERKVCRGGYASPAEVRLNGAEASLSVPVHPEDRIEFRPAESGMDAAPTVESEIRDWMTVTVILDGAEYPLETRVQINGVPADRSRRIVNGVSLEIEHPDSLQTVCEWLELPLDGMWFYRDGQLCSPEDSLQDGDVLNAELQGEDPAEEAPQPEPVQAAPPSPLAEMKAAEVPEPAPIPPAPPMASPIAPPLPQIYDRMIHVTLNGNPVELYPKPDHTPYQFVDMLNFVDIDPSNPKGGVVLRLNGADASYLEVIRDRDDITIRWDDV